MKNPASLGRFLPHRSEPITAVIPAKAGIHFQAEWQYVGFSFPGHRGNQSEKTKAKAKWIPAFAGMTVDTLDWEVNNPMRETPLLWRSAG